MLDFPPSPPFFKECHTSSNLRQEIKEKSVSEGRSPISKEINLKRKTRDDLRYERQN